MRNFHIRAESAATQKTFLKLYLLIKNVKLTFRLPFIIVFILILNFHSFILRDAGVARRFTFPAIYGHWRIAVAWYLRPVQTTRVWLCAREAPVMAGSNSSKQDFLFIPYYPNIAIILFIFSKFFTAAQLLHQLLHIHKMYTIYALKH